ncbi:MAG TPA: 6-phosphogluconolactonase [Rhodocyclaceae bacterium]|nr:6-phosphogluconolactonase [Rhodocyclaceae bacterium]
MRQTLHSFSNAAALDRALADFVALQLRDVISEHGRATLVVSGGRTPIGFFEQLREQSLAWNKVSITLADERWVDESGTDSNAHLVRTHLLQGAAASANFIPLFYPADTPNESAQHASNALDKLPSPFDVVVLGMGEDGHTASIFPDSPQLSAALNDNAACIAVEGSKPPPQRLTLTAPRLRQARHIVLHITGEKKWQVLGQALSEESVECFPIRAMLCTEHSSRHVFWTR